MTDRLRWAILGTGKIANRFAAALNNIPDRAELLAVGSRNQATGDAFGDQYGIPRWYAGYEQVVADPDVNVVYIGTPGVFHLANARMCLEHGKHVLCEKPLTMNAAEAAELIGLAREKNLFLMEAVWTRFFPIHVDIRERLVRNEIGVINGMNVNFTAKTPYDPEHRFYNVDLGAGVLLDLGIYGISLAFSLLGTPEKVVGLADFGETGADNQSAFILKYADGPLVTAMCSQISYDVKEAVIFGSEGKVEIHAPWYKPTEMTIHREGKAPEEIEMPLNGYNGYEFEALEVIDCITNGKTESDVMPLDETLAVIMVLDELRAQWGFKYPGEHSE